MRELTNLATERFLSRQYEQSLLLLVELFGLIPPVERIWFEYGSDDKEAFKDDKQKHVNGNGMTTKTTDEAEALETDGIRRKALNLFLTSALYVFLKRHPSSSSRGPLEPVGCRSPPPPFSWRPPAANANGSYFPIASQSNSNSNLITLSPELTNALNSPPADFLSYLINFSIETYWPLPTATELKRSLFHSSQATESIRFIPPTIIHTLILTSRRVSPFSSSQTLSTLLPVYFSSIHSTIGMRLSKLAIDRETRYGSEKRARGEECGYLSKCLNGYELCWDAWIAGCADVEGKEVIEASLAKDQVLTESSKMKLRSMLNPPPRSPPFPPSSSPALSRSSSADSIESTMTATPKNYRRLQLGPERDKGKQHQHHQQYEGNGIGVTVVGDDSTASAASQMGNGSILKSHQSLSSTLNRVSSSSASASSSSPQHIKSDNTFVNKIRTLTRSFHAAEEEGNYPHHYHPKLTTTTNTATRTLWVNNSTSSNSTASTAPSSTTFVALLSNRFRAVLGVIARNRTSSSMGYVILLILSMIGFLRRRRALGIGNAVGAAGGDARSRLRAAGGGWIRGVRDLIAG